VLDAGSRGTYRARPPVFFAFPEADPMTEPPENLNFAAHLFALNRSRPDKVAYVDDRSLLRYGELEDRARRFAAALSALGVRREERVLLLMLDCNEWPVAFLGCIDAGIVPVAVNTLLTVDDYAYMLAHSRAQAAIVSAALEPTLRKAMAAAPNEVAHVIVAGAAVGDGGGAPIPSPRPRRRAPTTRRSGSTRRARPAGRRAPSTPTPTRGGRPSSTARASSA
jgi:acyl-CoA synthetase (AMP-forming)/AMP-acid ligase II